MLNSEIIYVVKEQTDKHHISDDTGFEDEQILYYALRARSTFLSRKIKQYGLSSISHQSVMGTPCLNLVDAKECPCIPPKGCNILMTECVLPQSIGGVISVTNVDGDKEYTLTTPNMVKYRGSQRIKKFRKAISWFQLDEGCGSRIYVVTEKKLKSIKAILIPENPEELQRLKDCEGNNKYACVSTYDLDWKLDADLQQVVIDTTINNLLGSRSTISDIKNNATDDNTQNKGEIIGTNS